MNHIKPKLIILLFSIVLTPVGAEDWSIGMKTYHNVKVTAVHDDCVEITFTSDNGITGIGSPKLCDLPPDLQKRFNYDPLKAVAAEQKKDQARNEVMVDRYALWNAELKRKENVAMTAETDLAQSGGSGSDTKSLRQEADSIVDAYRSKFELLKKGVGELDQQGVSADDTQKIINAVFNQKVFVGMPKYFVLLSWGIPKSVNADINSSGKSEQLVYSDDQYVYIENGVVSSMQSSN